MQSMHYRQLLGMAILSFVAMYILMYAMVYRWDDVFFSWNQVYMAGLMTAPMIVIELLIMGMVYKNTSWNRVIVMGSVLVGVSCFLLIRQQTAIGDEQFLRSMIPHHSGAILMCKEASLQDPQIQELCANIISGQQAEIDWMNAKLNSLRP